PMVEMGRHLMAGEPVFISNYLFGGGYDWRTDASVFPIISPILPLVAPMTTTGWYFGIVDVVASFELMVIAASFAGCAAWLRQKHALSLSDSHILVASMSYAFSPVVLLFGSSWMGFINVLAAWPAVLVALQLAGFWRSTALLSCAFAFSLF